MLCCNICLQLKKLTILDTKARIDFVAGKLHGQILLNGQSDQAERKRETKERKREIRGDKLFNKHSKKKT